jgi:DNA-binding XRE family transcriptional regulator
MKHTDVTTPAGEELVLLAKADFEAMQAALESAVYARTADALARGEQEMLSAQEVADALAAPTPLAFWRAKRGITQKALADAVGVSQSYVADLEAGRRKGDPALAKRLARTLRLRMEDIVADDTHPNESAPGE